MTALTLWSTGENFLISIIYEGSKIKSVCLFHTWQIVKLKFCHNIQNSDRTKYQSKLHRIFVNKIRKKTTDSKDEHCRKSSDLKHVVLELLKSSSFLTARHFQWIHKFCHSCSELLDKHKFYKQVKCKMQDFFALFCIVLHCFAICWLSQKVFAFWKKSAKIWQTKKNDYNSIYIFQIVSDTETFRNLLFVYSLQCKTQTIQKSLILETSFRFFSERRSSSNKNHLKFIFKNIKSFKERTDSSQKKQILFSNLRASKVKQKSLKNRTLRSKERILLVLRYISQSRSQIFTWNEKTTRSIFVFSS